MTNSPLRDKLKTFQMAYFVPSTATWNLHENMDLFSVRMLSAVCMDLKRPFVIRHIETDLRAKVIAPYSRDSAEKTLNLFYNSLSGRCAECTDKDDGPF